MRNLKIDKVTVFIFAVAILGMSLILVRTSTYGIGVGSDEANFIAMARNLAAGDGLLDYQRSKMHSATWPPLYPVTLAAADFLGVDALIAARFINAATFGLIVLASGLWLKKRVKAPWLAGGGAVAVSVSPSLTIVSSHALSEPLFILFMLLIRGTSVNLLKTKRCCGFILLKMLK